VGRLLRDINPLKDLYGSRLRAEDIELIKSRFEAKRAEYQRGVERLKRGKKLLRGALSCGLLAFSMLDALKGKTASALGFALAAKPLSEHLSESILAAMRKVYDTNLMYFATSSRFNVVKGT